MRRLLAVGVVAIVSSSVAGGAARASGPLRLPGGDPLQRLRAEESRPSAQAAPRNPSRRAGIIWVALGSGAMLLVVISAIQTKRPPRLARVGAQSPEGGAHMRRRFNEREDGGAEQVEADTAEKRSAAIAAAEDIRARADSYAEQTRHEVDEAAAEVIARAERQARDRARAAEERQQALNVNVERTEERLRKLVTGLRE